MKLAVRLTLVIALTLAVLSCGGGSGTEVIAKKYLEAWKTYDIMTLRAMIAPDAVIDLGRGTLIGREHIVAAVEFSEGANSALEFNDVVVRGDTVECELVESNDIITACGFDEIRSYPRLIFENGLLSRQEQFKEMPKIRLYAEQVSLLRSWIRKNRPDLLTKVTTPSGQLKINREAGETMALMARAWSASMLVE